MIQAVSLRIGFSFAAALAFANVAQAAGGLERVKPSEGRDTRMERSPVEARRAQIARVTKAKAIGVDPAKLDALAVSIQVMGAEEPVALGKLLTIATQANAGASPDVTSEQQLAQAGLQLYEAAERGEELVPKPSALLKQAMEQNAAWEAQLTKALRTATGLMKTAKTGGGALAEVAAMKQALGARYDAYVNDCK